MSLKWSFFWVVALLCVLGSAALIYIAHQTVPPANSNAFIEVTKASFLCLGGIGVLLPMTLNVMNSIEEAKLKKVENTFYLLSRWDDPHLLKARNYTRVIKKKKQKISDVELVNEIESDEELEQSVILVTNYLEHVRYSFKTRRIDAATFKDSLGATLVSLIERFRPYYEKQPKAVFDDLNELKKLLE